MTTLVIIGYHGQADTGGHPKEITDSAITTSVLWGAGIKKAVRIPYSEMIDVYPTICSLMDVKPPETCQGRVIAEALSEYSGYVSPPKKLLKKMLEQFDEFSKKETDVSHILANLSVPQISSLLMNLSGIKEDFYDIDRFTEWPNFKTVAELVENNQKAIIRLNELLEEINKVK